MARETSDLTLRDYAAVVIRRKWIVVIATLLTTAVAVALSATQTPVYEARSEVLIQPRGEDGLFDTRTASLNARAVDTEVRVIEGQAVRDRVRADLGLDRSPPPVNAVVVGQTDVVSLQVRNTNATNAAVYANAYAEAYVSIRREQAVDELLAAGAEVQGAIDDLQAELDALSDDDPRRSALVTQLASFTTTLDQLRVDAALRTGGATVIREAVEPRSPVEPTPRRTATLALAAGLLLGLAAAFLVDYLDDKVRTTEDLEALTDLPVLAAVPIDRPPDDRPLAISAPDHPAVESYRGLRTNLLFLALDRRIRVVQVTSSLPAEGKTTTAANLAVVLARAGHRVALVDADLRRPRIHEVADVAMLPGLTDLLLGAAPRDVMRPVEFDDDNRLFVYPAGDVPANPSELLSSSRLASLLDQMGDHYDYVIVDSAPILPVSDSVALARAVDATVLVAHAGRVTSAEVDESIERLERVSAPLIGLVLNQVSESQRDAYGYGYGPAARRPVDVRADAPERDDTVLSEV